MRPHPLAACLALAATFAIGAAQANPQSETPASPAVAPAASTEHPAGNADAGRVLSYTCQGCHGLTGYKNAYPSYRVPKIGGQSVEYLTQALTGYREGKRIHPTMQAQSMSFSTQDIADLSLYLSTLK